MKHFIFASILFFTGNFLHAQDDLENLFADEETTEYASATFKASRIILGQSVEQPYTGNLIFDIQHQFGAINQGYKEFFGLDQASTRLGFAYGVTPWLMVGIGRTALEKTVDGSLKIRFIRQSKGEVNFPFTINYYGNIGVNGLDYSLIPIKYYFTHRLTFLNQLLIARKINSSISLQLMPTHIHRNLVERVIDENDIFALGAGGRFKITKRTSVNLEYFYVLSAQNAADFQNSLSFSFDIETGGHIFQLYITNATGMLEQQYITSSTGKWLEGDIHFGFNISRTFVLKKPKDFKE
ncbi:MAG: hypothetical protein JXR34_06220 [Bacteroidales bacterium]|nr:hypothetical protein [Bacteroidales bacterium]